MGYGWVFCQPVLGQAPRTACGRERHLADPAVSSILTAGLPSRIMTVPVKDLPFTGGGPTGSSGSVTAYCSAQLQRPLTAFRDTSPVQPRMAGCGRGCVKTPGLE